MIDTGLQNEVYAAGRLVGAVPLHEDLIGVTMASIHQLRRARRSIFDDAVGFMTLSKMGDQLQWHVDAAVLQSPLGGRRRAGYVAEGEIVARLKYEKIGLSQVTKFLTELDQKFSPFLAPGQLLRRVNPETGVAEPVSKPGATGRILLIVHGTFSNGESVLTQLKSTPAGEALLRGACTTYTEILLFEHATLSVSPILNAIDLARLFRDSAADVDVVAHSRGGLVTRWWTEVLSPGQRGKRRAILVGSPLAGTSLASPPRLRRGMDLFANIAGVIGTASSLIPFLTVAVGLLKVFSAATKTVAKTPLIDMGVAMVPGLAGQSRVDNNPELGCLNTDSYPCHAEYSVVSSDFQPNQPGWAFWKYFTNLKLNAANTLADNFVFAGKNDLVVDLDSMNCFNTSIPACAKDQYLDLGTNDRVFHTNYFVQPEVLDFIRKRLSF